MQVGITGPARPAAHRFSTAARRLYQISMIKTHLTAIYRSLARRGLHRGARHHKRPAPWARRGGERAKDHGLRWGGYAP